MNDNIMKTLPNFLSVLGLDEEPMGLFYTVAGILPQGNSLKPMSCHSLSLLRCLRKCSIGMTNLFYQQRPGQRFRKKSREVKKRGVKTLRLNEKAYTLKEMLLNSQITFCGNWVLYE